MPVKSLNNAKICRAKMKDKNQPETRKEFSVNDWFELF